jgi:hypothetical protein
MNRSSAHTDGRPKSTSEVGPASGGDGEVRTDDGPGTTWYVGVRPRPVPTGGNHSGHRTAPVGTTPHRPRTPASSVEQGRDRGVPADASHVDQQQPRIHNNR